MSAGRPVIGSSEGGMKEILKNGNGILVNPHDIKQMADAVINLLNDEKTRWQYGRKGRSALMENYSEELIGGQIETHYRRTIENTKHRI